MTQSRREMGTPLPQNKELSELTLPNASLSILNVWIRCWPMPAAAWEEAMWFAPARKRKHSEASPLLFLALADLSARGRLPVMNILSARLHGKPLGVVFAVLVGSVSRLS